MAEVCISYARVDQARVRRLYEALRRKFSVWWDEDITAGDFRSHIEQQLQTALCVVPVWSAASRVSGNVTDEVDTAIRADVPVLPVRIEAVAPPIGFGRLHMIDLAGWNGDEEEDEFRRLVSRLRTLVSGDASTRRQDRIRIGRKELAVPCMAFSVSSHETQIAPEYAVQALALWKPAAVLVSAYDIDGSTDPAALMRGMANCREAGAVILLDSGNYEAYRKRDSTWTPERLHKVLEGVPYDGAFMFDNTTPASEWREAVRDVVRGYQRDSDHASAPVFPILHAPRAADGALRAEALPDMAIAVMEEVNPPLIAVPERELGDGLVERARTVYALRQALNGAGHYQPLHLLGTGNHVTAAVLAVAGADCFDGLEWCRTVADDQTGGLYHFQHYDFVAWQSAASESRLLREVTSDAELPYAVRVAFHNLDFFDRWMAELRSALWADRADQFLAARIPGGLKSMDRLSHQLPAVFA